MTQQAKTQLHFVRDNTGLSSRESDQPTICTVQWCDDSRSVLGIFQFRATLEVEEWRCVIWTRVVRTAPAAVLRPGPGWMLPRNFQQVTAHLTRRDPDTDTGCECCATLRLSTTLYIVDKICLTEYVCEGTYVMLNMLLHIDCVKHCTIASHWIGVLELESNVIALL